MSNKKLLIVTTTGASLIFYQNLMPQLKQEFEVIACTRDDEHSRKFSQQYSVDVQYVEFARNFELKSDLAACWQLRNVINDTDPAIILFNTPKASSIGLLVARILGVSNRVYVIHGLRYQGFSGVKRIFYSFIERLNFLNATKLVSVSTGIKDIILAEQLTKKSVKLFHYGSLGGVDVDTFTVSGAEKILAKQRLNLEGSSGVFGFVGRLTEDKGIHELLSAFNRLKNKYPNIHLLLVGPLDSANPRIKQKIDECAATIWVGEVSNVSDYLASMDIFVFPTYREGLGMSLIEAQIAGVPAIASDVTGCNEIIEHGTTGILLPAKDHNRLTVEMENLLLAPRMRNLLAKSARTVAVERYNSKSVSNDLMHFLRSIR